MKSMLNYVSRVLYLTWRQRLGSKLHEKYFGKMMFYHLNILDNSLDNMYALFYILSMLIDKRFLF